MNEETTKPMTAKEYAESRERTQELVREAEIRREMIEMGKELYRRDREKRAIARARSIAKASPMRGLALALFSDTGQFLGNYRNESEALGYFERNEFFGKPVMIRL